MAYTLNAYHADAADFATYANRLYPFLALAEEAGEVAGKVAKMLRGDKPLALVQNEAIKKELGDVLWQLSACASECGFMLEDIAEANIDKLEDRRTRDMIQGEGDER